MLDEYMLRHAPPAWQPFFADEVTMAILRNICSRVRIMDSTCVRFWKQFTHLMPQDIKVLILSQQYAVPTREMKNKCVTRMSYVPYDVTEGDCKMHNRIWRPFVLALMRWINDKCDGICIVLSVNKADNGTIQEYIGFTNNKILQPVWGSRGEWYKEHVNQFLLSNKYAPIKSW